MVLFAIHDHHLSVEVRSVTFLLIELLDRELIVKLYEGISCVDLIMPSPADTIYNGQFNELALDLAS
jgi:hypothetical protein